MVVELPINLHFSIRWDNIKSVKKNKVKYGQTKYFFYVAGFGYQSDVSSLS